MNRPLLEGSNRNFHFCIDIQSPLLPFCLEWKNRLSPTKSSIDTNGSQ